MVYSLARVFIALFKQNKQNNVEEDILHINQSCLRSYLQLIGIALTTTHRQSIQLFQRSRLCTTNALASSPPDVLLTACLTVFDLLVHRHVADDVFTINRKGVVVTFDVEPLHLHPAPLQRLRELLLRRERRPVSVRCPPRFALFMLMTLEIVNHELAILTLMADLPDKERVVICPFFVVLARVGVVVDSHDHDVVDLRTTQIEVERVALLSKFDAFVHKRSTIAGVVLLPPEKQSTIHIDRLKDANRKALLQ